ncbi:GNAT family N-acetyltransferase [Acidithiobacillus sp.]|uniref:GNAT family N-acetyltransferase n=1 Tax=Acidithiobacillus sp. TaxID=1872118 RepID=UPI0025C41B9A|nr:GNAT family N-acetyltransferase [Acidithiobacillus sp.]
MTAVVARLAGTEDLPSLVALVNGVYRGPAAAARAWTTEAQIIDGQRCDLEMLQALQQSPAGFFLLLEERETGRICAACHLQDCSEAVAETGMLSVALDRQGKGLGSQLLSRAEAEARARWRSRVMRLWVIDCRAELLAFYARRGYRATDIYRSFPQDPRYGVPRLTGLRLMALEKNLPESDG